MTIGYVCLQQVNSVKFLLNFKQKATNITVGEPM